MNRIFSPLLVSGMILILWLSTPLVYAQVANGYTIASWYQFKKAAVSYTFDDNTAKQLSVALPLFDAYHFKVTFYPVINWSPDWSGLKAASASGHEVGSHTVSHSNLDSLGLSGQEYELQASQSIINRKIPDAQCLSIAYPFCSQGNLALIRKYYIAGRVCSGVIESSTPANFYQISSIIAGSLGAVKTAFDFNNKVNQAKVSGGWCVFLIHGIDNDGGFSPLSSGELAAHLAYMSKNSKDFWVATFADVVKYIRERNAGRLSEIKRNSHSLELAEKDSLDHSIYNLPLTVRRVLPEGWKGVIITCGGKTLSSALVNENGKQYVQFDLAPGQDVILSPSKEGIKSQP